MQAGFSITQSLTLLDDQCLVCLYHGLGGKRGVLQAFLGLKMMRRDPLSYTHFLGKGRRPPEYTTQQVEN